MFELPWSELHWSDLPWPTLAAANLDLVSITVFSILTVIVGTVLLLLSELLGPRRRDPEKETIYECGVPLLDSAREPFTVKFYLVAILFILFDIFTFPRLSINLNITDFLSSDTLTAFK